MREFCLKILASDKEVFDGAAVSVTVPCDDGAYGILAMHANTIMALVPGKLTYKTADGTAFDVAVTNGLVKIEDGDVLVLSDTAERPEEIDAVRAREAAAAAKEELLQKRSTQEYYAAQATLARELNRLKLKGESLN